MASEVAAVAQEQASAKEIMCADIRGEDLIQNGWFMEKNSQWPGQAFAIKVEEVLVSTRSKYQDILVFKSKEYGNVLVLDGVIQCTQKDEFAYQEMLTHLPLNCHPNPKNVLIIGGGDGGVAREVAKHPCVETITQCEIDEEVINVSKKYLPYMACGFDSPKMHLHVGDGFAFMQAHQDQFDVIISDTSDPVGPAERLFSEEYYKLMHSALRQDGVLAVQGESMWLHLPLIRGLLDFTGALYAKSSYATGYIPSYPCGQIGYLLASKNPDTVFQQPCRELTEVEMEEMKLHYYTPAMHRAAFVLPRNVEKALGFGSAGKNEYANEPKEKNGH